MNKLITIIASCLFLLTFMSSCNRTDEERSHILKVYNWADYIDEDVLAEFPAWYKEQTGEDIRIIYQVFDINEIMLTKIERGHEDFDLICPSEYIIERMLKKNLLVPIDRNFGKTPDYLDNVSPYIRGQLNKLSQPGRKTIDYVVPYMWGTAGILYNKQFVEEKEVESWECLWDSKFRNKILMKDSYRDSYGTAIIYAHAKELEDGTVTVEQLMNDNSPEAIAIAEELLKKMKPNIAGWEADFGKEMMTKGKAWLNFTWSGDAVWAMDEAEAVGVELDYEVPREGSNIWYDGWAIPKYARNVKAASYFIDYLCRPDVALRNMDAIGYVSAIATPEIMEAKIDSTIEKVSDLSYFFGPGADSIRINPVQYPDRKVVERCAMIRDFGDRTELVLEMWSRVKGDNLNTGIVLLIFAVFGVLVGLLGIGTITQVNGIASAVKNFFDPDTVHTVSLFGNTYSWATVIACLILTLCVGLVVLGGIQRIAKVSQIVVPFMAVLYVVLALIIVITNITAVPAAIVTIVKTAFNGSALAGGAMGTMVVAMQKGIARGIFSNESGLGSAPIAAAAAQTKEPVRHGLVSMTGTFIDTIVICTMTGLSIVITETWNTGLEGVAITTAAFQKGLPFPPQFASFALMLCLVFFAFTTILGWDYYGERCVEYLFNRNKAVVKGYRWLYILAVFIGPYMTVAAVWNIADIFNALMAFPNLIALLALSGVVVKETKEFHAKHKGSY